MPKAGKPDKKCNVKKSLKDMAMKGYKGGRKPTAVASTRG